MNQHYLYLFVDLACIAVPFIFSFHPKLRFFLEWKSLLIGTLVMMALFIPWDVFFTMKGIWSFNEKYTLGPRLLKLPIEEWLFFICIPYACIFTYHCLKYFFQKEPASRIVRPFFILIAFFFLAIALFNTQRWYTFSAHLLCALLLAAHLFVWRSKYLGWFMLTFALILTPFLISNGILTGLEFWKYPFFNFDVDAIGENIVAYNNNHNLRFRLFSMPVDDIAYGMLMLLLTTTVYEKFSKPKG